MVRVLRRTAARCTPVAQTYSIGRSFDGKDLLVIEFSSRPGQHELSKPPPPRAPPEASCTCPASGCLSPGGALSKDPGVWGRAAHRQGLRGSAGCTGCTVTVTGRMAALGARGAQAWGRGSHMSGKSDLEGQLRLQARRPPGIWGDSVSASCVPWLCDLTMAPRPQAGGPAPARLL